MRGMTTLVDPSAPFLTAEEAARLLRLSVRTVRRRVAQGLLQAAKSFPGPGGRFLIRRTDLLACFGLSDPAPTVEPAPRRARRTAAAAAEVAK